MEKTTIFKCLLVCFTSIFLCSADCSKNTADCHSSLTISNATAKAIYFSVVYDSAMLKLNYPPGASPETYKCAGNGIKPYNTFGCMEGNINYSGHGYIYLFDADVIENTPWEIIKQNRLFLKRYALTTAQFDSCNWVISYP